MVQTVVYLSPELDKKIKGMGEKWKLSKSDTIQKVIQVFFEEGGEQLGNEEVQLGNEEVQTPIE